MVSASSATSRERAEDRLVQQQDVRPREERRKQRITFCNSPLLIFWMDSFRELVDPEGAAELLRGGARSPSGLSAATMSITAATVASSSNSMFWKMKVTSLLISSSEAKGRRRAASAHSMHLHPRRVRTPPPGRLQGALAIPLGPSRPVIPRSGKVWEKSLMTGAPPPDR